MAYLLKSLAVSFAVIISSSDVAVGSTFEKSPALPSTGPPSEVCDQRSDCTVSEVLELDQPLLLFGLDSDGVDEDKVGSEEDKQEQQETAFIAMAKKLSDSNTYVEGILFGVAWDQMDSVGGTNSDHVRAALTGMKEIMGLDEVNVLGMSKETKDFWDRATGYHLKFKELDPLQQITFLYWLTTEGEQNEERFIEKVSNAVNGTVELMKEAGQETWKLMQETVEKMSNTHFSDIGIKPIKPDGLMNGQPPVIAAPDWPGSVPSFDDKTVDDFMRNSEALLEKAKEALVEEGEVLAFDGSFRLGGMLVKAAFTSKLKKALASTTGLDEKTHEQIFEWTELLGHKFVDSVGAGLSVTTQKLLEHRTQLLTHSGHLSKHALHALFLGKVTFLAAASQAAGLYAAAFVLKRLWCDAQAEREKSFKAETQFLRERRAANGRDVRKWSYCGRGTRSKRQAAEAVETHRRQQEEVRARADRLAREEAERERQRNASRA
jgi:hypothetical protein